ncbi:MAG: phosphatase PAP2 family protein [Caulobacter sp.]|nr:phosphatase PAP2 family protein [Caulobacter sp.]
MIGMRHVLAGTTIALTLTVTVVAQEDRPTPYLAADATPDALLIVGGPPAEDSPQAAAERAYFLETRAMEGSPRWKQAAIDAELFGDLGHASFACAIGKAITVKDTPTLSRMLDRMVMDMGKAVGVLKTTFNRPRPMVGHDDAPLCVAREEWMKTNSAYASSNAAAGWGWALVIAELDPQKASAVLVRGREYGENRVICGLHYASDITAGQTMASATVAALHANPEFLKDLETARTELAAAPPALGCGG